MAAALLLVGVWRKSGLRRTPSGGLLLSLATGALLQTTVLLILTVDWGVPPAWAHSAPTGVCRSVPRPENPHPPASIVTEFFSVFATIFLLAL